jgi:hypothetical protein
VATARQAIRRDRDSVCGRNDISYSCIAHLRACLRLLQNGERPPPPRLSPLTRQILNPTPQRQNAHPSNRPPKLPLRAHIQICSHSPQAEARFRQEDKVCVRNFSVAGPRKVSPGLPRPHRRRRDGKTSQMETSQPTLWKEGPRASQAQSGIFSMPNHLDYLHHLEHHCERDNHQSGLSTIRAEKMITRCQNKRNRKLSETAVHPRKMPRMMSLTCPQHRSS